MRRENKLKKTIQLKLDQEKYSSLLKWMMLRKKSDKMEKFFKNGWWRIWSEGRKIKGKLIL